jgi:hypothetical protein
MKALGVLESKWNPIRQKLVRRLLEEQDKVLRSYFAQKGGTRGQRGGGTHGQGREHVKWDMYVEAIRNQDPNAESRVELMSGGEVLGTALITWLKNAEDKIEVARRVVKTVWPRVEPKTVPNSSWVASCDTKMDLVTEIESWMRTYSARCERHIIKLE